MKQGKNSLKSSIDIAVQRIRYKVSSYAERDGIGPVQVVDFTFGEFVNYGRIDTAMNTVYLDSSNLSSVVSQGGNSSVALVNFVADAFNDLVRDFEKASLLDVIPTNDPHLSSINPVLGYTDPKQKYIEYIDSLVKRYISEYIIKKKKEKKILTFGAFLRHFMLFLKNDGLKNPVTFTSWQRSKKSSIYASGLAVSIADFPQDDDTNKVRFLKSPIFPYFKNVCLKRGFSISHNAPWVLVADLGSPQMKQYFSKYFLINPQSVFDGFYKQTLFEDINLLKQSLLRVYNSFVISYSYEREHVFCKNNLLKTNILKRKNITITEMDKKFKNSFWLRMYANIRYFEERGPFSPADLDEKIKILLILQKTFDTSAAIRYINEEFRKLYHQKPGGLLSQHNKY